MKSFLFSFLIIFCGLVFPSVLTGDSPADSTVNRYLMRTPDIHGDIVVFVSGGDIWKAPRQGGQAIRLTIHDGEERNPRFSPCGRLIAFTGEYDGNSDVYVMDHNGAHIRRVTHHPGRDTVIGWHPQKGKILFQSARQAASRYTHLYLIRPDGTGLERLPIHEIARGSFSPDGSRIAYNRVSRAHRTWKRYRGGLAQDIYLYDFKNRRETRLTGFPGTDRMPLWIGDRIFFVSDRSGILNLYSQAPGGNSDPVALTRHTIHDVRFPATDGERVVFESAGKIFTLNIASGEEQELAIHLSPDAPERRPYRKNVRGFITGFHISPRGKRAVITARGEVFTVPVEHGAPLNITRDSGSRDRGACFSPDGKTIAYLSDRTGEYQIYTVDSRSREKARKHTDFPRGYRQNLLFSPDGKMIAFADQTLSLHILDVRSGNTRRIDKAEYENIDIDLEDKPIYDFTWSPDSRYLAYSKMDADLVTKIYIHDLQTRRTHCVSQGIFNDFNPVFTRDGQHLVFVSNRSFSPTYGDMDWEMVYKDLARIYALTLQKDRPGLFDLRQDHPGEKTPSENTEEGKNIPVSIDFDGIAQRIEVFPLPPSNYRQLSVGKTTIFYLDSPDGDYNRFKYRDLGPRTLCAFTLDTRESRRVAENVKDYRLSDTGSHLIFQSGRKLAFQKITPGAKPSFLDFSDLFMTIDPIREWEQIYTEAWRIERDFYYEPNMKGNDWEAIRKKYHALLQRASYRGDVGYIIGEMIGELNTSHTYIYGGDHLRRASRVPTGLLGTDWETDRKNNRYRFGKIYRVADWAREIVPPLSRPGHHVREGEYLLEVNHRDVTADRNIYSYFQGLAGQPVTLRVSPTPHSRDAREVTVKPLASDRQLRYLDWVEENRRKVLEKSGGKLGYIHLPDTYLGSSVEFPKYFFSQLTKKGIIIDGRYNGGGLDPSIFLRRLNREIHSYWTRRYSKDQVGPPNAPHAHLVLITNKQAGSGGDELPYVFQNRKMGKVIGTRTWGGLVGVSMFIQLIDGGGITAPDYRIYSPEGKWIIENKGVQPDIVVENMPSEMSRGVDAQLNRAIEYLLSRLREDPLERPGHPPFIVEKRETR